MKTDKEIKTEQQKPEPDKKVDFKALRKEMDKLPLQAQGRAIMKAMLLQKLLGDKV